MMPCSSDSARGSSRSPPGCQSCGGFQSGWRDRALTVVMGTFTNSDALACFGRLLAILALMSFGGCKLMGRDGPVPQKSVLGRQYSDQGRAAMDRGDWLQASRLWEKAVTACPADVEARRACAQALWHEGRQDEAVAQIQVALRLSGNDPALAAQAGEMCLAKGQLEKARRLATDALAINPRLGEVWALRARVERASGHFDQALADTYRALDFLHDDKQLLAELAELHQRLGRPQQALLTLETLRDTYAAGEEPTAVLVAQGQAYASLDRYPDAVEVYSLAAKRGAASADLYCSLADAQLRCGRAAEAQECLAQALLIDPRHAASRALQARLEVATRPVVQIAR